MHGKCVRRFQLAGVEKKGRSISVQHRKSNKKKNNNKEPTAYFPLVGIQFC